ncbi:MAG: efflux RND transporter permease subunit [Planctomycetota bacterium]|nr:efflux RND transporter permease subunit [Planctomycetota bacterium]
MNPTSFTVNHRTTTIAVVLVSLFLGLQTFSTMPRREDPEITIRSAIVITHWPGATAEKVEELVTDPIETAINQMSEVDTIHSQSKTGMSVVTVDLIDTTPAREVDQAWDEMRNKIDAIHGDLPQGCGIPQVNSDFGDVGAVCLTLYQRPVNGASEIPEGSRLSWRQLEVLADQVETELKTIPTVAKIDKLGIQDEVIYLEVPSADWAKIDITEDHLAQLLDAQNIVAPGGQIDTGDSRYSVRPTGEFEAYRAMRDVVVGRHEDGLPVFLRDLPIQIERTFVDPPKPKFRFVHPDFTADRALLLAITMKSGENVVKMGESIRAKIAELKATTLPYDVELTQINDLPRQVGTLIEDFVSNLWQAIAIVLAVAFLMMGWRPALIMATAVPLSMVAAFTVVRMFGVELEQFSIASLIIALGMIVDNAIVVSDNSVRMIDEGLPRKQAVIKGATSLAIPIITSTLTTVAAFLPMLTIEGSSGEYVRSLPIVVATTLLMSYLVAMLVTPIMCFWLLKPTVKDAGRKTLVARLAGLFRRKKGEAPVDERELEAKDGPSGYDKFILWCLGHKGLTLGIAGAAFVASLQLVPLIGNQFFPMGDRDQFFVHVWLPEGSSIKKTEEICKQVEQRILDSRVTDIEGRRVDRLAHITSMVGTGGPRLMLTSNPEQNFPNYAHMVVNTSDPTYSAPWVEEIKKAVVDIPGARIDVRRFMLGPPVKNPVEIRLIGDDADELRVKAEELIGIFRRTPGASDPQSNWRNPSYEVEVRIDPDAANLAGVTNMDVANTLNGLISGRRLTTYREGDHLVPVFLRMQDAERKRLSDLSRIYVNGRSGKVPLSSLATLEPAWQPAVIARRDQRRTVTVGGQAQAGFLANQVSTSMEADVEKLVATMSPGSRWEYGGEMEESTKSQAQLSAAFGLSGLLILLVLISQYNSFAKPFIVLAAVPLSLIGALIGLFTTGWALGFMPMLGIISLAGVVINNAIILIDFIETGVREGKELRTAVAEAGRLRMKPILLTTLTTVGGMLPLALFAGPMWAGMAWAVIFGLALSTALTLLVIPTLYTLCVERFGLKIQGMDQSSSS